MKGHLGFRCRGCVRPGPPTNLRQVGTGSLGNAHDATLAWDEPAVTGGGPLLGYIVEHALNYERTAWETFAETSPSVRQVNVSWCLDDNVFRVRAVNRCGASVPSEEFSSWIISGGTDTYIYTNSTTVAPPCWALSAKFWCIGCGGTSTSGGSAGGLAWKTWTRLPQDDWGGAFSVVVRNAHDGGLPPLASVAHGGATVIAYGAQLTNNGTAAGGDGGVSGISGGTGYPITWDGWTGSYKYGGAIGGWSGTDESGSPILLPPVSQCQRRPALDRAGLFAAVSSLGMRVLEECEAEAAFGSGGVTFLVPHYGGDVRVDFAPSYGGGGFDATNPGGPGCVIVKYS